MSDDLDFWKEAVPEWEELKAPIYAWKLCILDHNEQGWYLHPATGTEESFSLVDWNEIDAAPEWEWQPMQADLGLVPGFHCWNSVKAAIDYSQSGFQPQVLAKIEVSGHVIEHEFGYRVQKFRVIGIHAPLKTEDERSKLADVLGWPFGIGHVPISSGPWAKKFSKEEPPYAPRPLYVNVHVGGTPRTYKKAPNGRSRILDSPGTPPRVKRTGMNEAIALMRGDPSVKVFYGDEEKTMGQLQSLLDGFDMLRETYQDQMEQYLNSWSFDSSQD